MRHVILRAIVLSLRLRERWRTCPSRRIRIYAPRFTPRKKEKEKRKKKKKKKNSDNNRAPRLEKYFSELILRAYLSIDCTKICIAHLSCFIHVGCRALDDERDTIYSLGYPGFLISLLLLKFCLIYIAFYL